MCVCACVSISKLCIHDCVSWLLSPGSPFSHPENHPFILGVSFRGPTEAAGLRATRPRPTASPQAEGRWIWVSPTSTCYQGPGFQPVWRVSQAVEGEPSRTSLLTLGLRFLICQRRRDSSPIPLLPSHLLATLSKKTKQRSWRKPQTRPWDEMGLSRSSLIAPGTPLPQALMISFVNWGQQRPLPQGWGGRRMVESRPVGARHTWSTPGWHTWPTSPLSAHGDLWPGG